MRMDQRFDCPINYASLCISAFRTSWDTGFSDCQGLCGNINFPRIRKPVLRSQEGSLFCDAPWSTKHSGYQNYMDSHHLVVRLVAVVYICVIYLLTLAMHVTDINILPLEL